MPLGAVVAPGSLPAGMAIGAAENIVASGMEVAADDIPFEEAKKRIALDAAIGLAIPGGIGLAARGIGKRLARPAIDIAEEGGGGIPKAAGAAVIGDAESALPVIRKVEDVVEDPSLPPLDEQADALRNMGLEQFADQPRPFKPRVEAGSLDESIPAEFMGAEVPGLEQFMDRPKRLPPTKKKSSGGGTTPEMKKALREAEAAVEGRNLPKEIKEMVESLPSVEKGSVRLYRWEGKGAVKAGAAGGKEGGVWFEKSPGVYYSKGTPVASGRYIDIPEAEFKKLQADPNATEVQLSADLAKKASPIKPDTDFKFSTAGDIAETEARVTGLGKAKPAKGFDPEKHSLSDFVALKGGLAKDIESSAEAGAYDLTKGRARVGPGNRQFFKAGGMHPDDAIQAAKEAGFFRMDAEVTTDDLLREMDLDIKSLTGTGGTRKWSNLRQDFDISDVGTGKKSIWGGEEGSTRIFSDFAAAVAKADEPASIRARVSSVFRHWGRGYTQALNKMGPEGRALSRRVEGYRRYAEPRISGTAAKYKKAVKGLSDVEFGDVQGSDRRGGNLVDVLDKGHKPMNAKVAAAAQQIQKLTDDVVRQARVFGWDIGEIENYFPHRLDRELPVPGELQPVSGNVLLVHKRARTYNLERHREHLLKNFRRDRAVLEEYFIESYKQLGELAYFGVRRGSASEEIVEAVKAGFVSAKQAKVMKRFNLLEEQHAEALNLIAAMTNPADRRKALEGFTRLTGNTLDTGVDHMMAMARNVNAFISLSTSAIAQTTQIAHIFTEVGGKSLLRGLRDVAKDYSQVAYRAELSGAVFPNFVKEYQKAAGVTAKNRTFMWGLGTMDKNLRIVADASSRQWVKMLEKNAAKGRGYAKESLEALGIRGGRKATEKDFDRIAKMVADRTQFRADVPDLPVAMAHPLGKTVFQFGSFMYAHARWLTQKPISGRGRIAKTARYLAAATVVGEAAQDLRSLLLRHDLIGEDIEELNYNDIKAALGRAAGTRRIPPNHPFWRSVQNIAYVGGLGIYQMVYENIMRRGGVETLLGPTVSRGGDIKRDLVDPFVQGRLDDIRYESVLRRQVPTLLKRQVWDRVLGDPEEQRRGRPSRQRRGRSR